MASFRCAKSEASIHGEGHFSLKCLNWLVGPEKIMEFRPIAGLMNELILDKVFKSYYICKIINLGRDDAD
ncbi:MAG: hypothetical protein ACOY90_03545 [Candidatus Zhuqueibacterota bacterium]